MEKKKKKKLKQYPPHKCLWHKKKFQEKEKKVPQQLENKIKGCFSIVDLLPREARQSKEGQGCNRGFLKNKKYHLCNKLLCLIFGSVSFSSCTFIIITFKKARAQSKKNFIIEEF